MSQKIALAGAPRICLRELMVYSQVRTIPVECRLLPYDAGEWPLTIGLERESALRNVLPAQFRNAMFLYAYVRGGEALHRLFRGHTRHEKSEKLRLNEFEGGFLLIVRQADGKEEPIYLVSTEDVCDLVREARHPNLPAAESGI